jgi:hypothetical protein
MAGSLHFFDDYGSGWLWPGDAATRAAFGPGPIGNALDARLSPETRALAAHLLDRSAASLNQNYPPDGCLWPLGERLAFDAAADALLVRVSAELGAEFLIRDERRRLGP